MEIETLLNDSNAAQMTDLLGFSTQTGKDRFLHQIRQVTDDPGTLSKRQNVIQGLRAAPGEHSAALLQKATALESEVACFFDRSTLETESYGQLLFSSWDSLKILNTVPYLLLAVSVLKIWLNPAFVVLSPFLMFVGPYLFLRFTEGFRLPFHAYMQMMLRTLGIEFPLNLKQIFQGGLALFSIGQSIYQTVQSSRHLHTIDAEVQKKGRALRQLGQLCNELLLTLGQKTEINPLGDLPADDRMAFAEGWDHPGGIRQALLLVGDFEVVYRIAECKAMRRVRVYAPNPQKPALRIQKGFDPFLPEETRKTYSVSLGHGILTGPNRGGKSSVLRSLLLNVLLAQTIGFSFAKRLQIRLFSWIASGLKLADTPGKTSMFEREVEFATQIQRAARSGTSGLVVFDELFHSTNPPDGKRTAQLFLDTLWKHASVTSFISTHVFELAEGAPVHVQRLCVPAYRADSGELVFTHELKSGICKESSVDLILREKGFWRAAVSQAKEKASTGGE